MKGGYKVSAKGIGAAVIEGGVKRMTSKMLALQSAAGGYVVRAKAVGFEDAGAIVSE